MQHQISRITEKPDKKFGFGLYSKFHILIRIISFVLIVTFLIQDIAWAYPDKLAPSSFFTEGKSSTERAYARYIEGLIEKSGIPRDQITLEAVKAVLMKHKEENWSKNKLIYRESRDDFLVTFPSGNTIRYYIKDKTGPVLTELLPPGTVPSTYKVVSSEPVSQRSSASGIEHLTPTQRNLFRRRANEILERFGIEGKLNGRTISGKTVDGKRIPARSISKWAKAHNLLSRWPVYTDDIIQKQRKEYVRRLGQSHDAVGVIRAILLQMEKVGLRTKTEGDLIKALGEEYGDLVNLGQPELTKKDLSKARRERSRKKGKITKEEQKRLKFKLLYPFMWKAAGVAYPAIHAEEARLGKLSGNIDLTGMRLRDLPIFAVDENGRMLEWLMAGWPQTPSQRPRDDYYKVRRVSVTDIVLAEILPLSLNFQPEESKPVSDGRQSASGLTPDKLLPVSLAWTFPDISLPQISNGVAAWIIRIMILVTVAKLLDVIINFVIYKAKNHYRNMALSGIRSRDLEEKLKALRIFRWLNRLKLLRNTSVENSLLGSISDTVYDPNLLSFYLEVADTMGEIMAPKISNSAYITHLAMKLIPFDIARFDELTPAEKLVLGRAVLKALYKNRQLDEDTRRMLLNIVYDDLLSDVLSEGDVEMQREAVNLLGEIAKFDLSLEESVLKNLVHIASNTAEDDVTLDKNGYHLSVRKKAVLCLQDLIHCRFGEVTGRKEPSKRKRYGISAPVSLSLEEPKVICDYLRVNPTDFKGHEEISELYKEAQRIISVFYGIPIKSEDSSIPTPPIAFGSPRQSASGTITHTNILPIEAFDLPREMFGPADTSRPEANFVRLWQQALDEAFGPDSTIINLWGSLSYFYKDGKIDWEGIHDADMTVYIIDEYYPKKTKKAVKKMTQAQERFLELTRSSGLDTRLKQLFKYKEPLTLLPLSYLAAINEEKTRYTTFGGNFYCPYTLYFGSPAAIEKMQEAIRNISFKLLLLAGVKGYSRLFGRAKLQNIRRGYVTATKTFKSFAQLAQILGLEVIRRKVLEDWRQLTAYLQKADYERWVTAKERLTNAYFLLLDPDVADGEAVRLKIEDNLKRLVYGEESGQARRQSASGKALEGQIKEELASLVARLRKVVVKNQRSMERYDTAAFGEPKEKKKEEKLARDITKAEDEINDLLDRIKTLLESLQDSAGIEEELRNLYEYMVATFDIEDVKDIIAEIKRLYPQIVNSKIAKTAKPTKKVTESKSAEPATPFIDYTFREISRNRLNLQNSPTREMTLELFRIIARGKNGRIALQTLGKIMRGSRTKWEYADIRNLLLVLTHPYITDIVRTMIMNFVERYPSVSISHLLKNFVSTGRGTRGYLEDGKYVVGTANELRQLLALDERGAKVISTALFLDKSDRESFECDGIIEMGGKSYLFETSYGNAVRDPKMPEDAIRRAIKRVVAFRFRGRTQTQIVIMGRIISGLVFIFPETYQWVSDIDDLKRKAHEIANEEGNPGLPIQIEFSGPIHTYFTTEDRANYGELCARSEIISLDTYIKMRDEVFDMEAHLRNSASRQSASGAVSQPSKADVIAAFNAFDSDFKATLDNCEIELISTGHINTTYCLINKATDRKYIIQRLNTIFDIPAIDHNLQLFEEAEGKAKGLPSYWQSLSYLNAHGASHKIYYDKGGAAWRVMNFVPGEIHIFGSFSEIPPEDRPEAARSLGEAIAIFRRMLDSIPVESWKEPLPNFHNPGYHLNYLDSILRGEEVVLNLSHDTTRKVKRQDDIIAKYSGRIETLLGKIQARRNLVSSLDDLQQVVTHGDTKLSNAVFIRDEKTGILRCVCFIDLDTIQKGNELDDLGDALRFAGNPAGESPQNIEDVTIDKEVVLNIIEGYLSKIAEFYGEETAKRLRGYVFKAFALFLYSNCLRFFADALVGNKYFKLTPGTPMPEDLNLYRAEVQMRALEELEKALPELERLLTSEPLRVLEMCGGHGDFAQKYLKANPGHRLTMIDISSMAVETARRKGIDVHRINAAHTGFKDGRFGRVILNRPPPEPYIKESLLPPLPDLFKEAERVLEAGGEIWFTSIRSDYAEQKIIGYLEATGFVNIKLIKPVPEDYPHLDENYGTPKPDYLITARKKHKEFRQSASGNIVPTVTVENIDAKIARLKSVYGIDDKEFPIAWRRTKGGQSMPYFIDKMKYVLHSIGLEGKKTFVDIGCGDGRIVFLAAILGLESTGIEIDPNFEYEIEEAKKKLLAQGVSEAANASFVYRDVRDNEVSLAGYDIYYHHQPMSADDEKLSADISDKIVRDAQNSSIVINRHFACQLHHEYMEEVKIDGLPERVRILRINKPEPRQSASGMEKEPEKSYNELFSEFVSNLPNLRNILLQDNVSLQAPLQDTEKAVILYADSILEQGAVMDMEDTLKKAKLSTIVVYGQKPGTAKVLEDLIRRADSSIKIIKIEETDIVAETGYDETKQLDKLMRLAPANGINNGTLIGVIKGPTQDTESVSRLSQERKVAVVSLEAEGVYSFAQLLNALTKIKNTDGPIHKKWFYTLPAMRKISDDIRKLYEDYIRLLEQVATKA